MKPLNNLILVKVVQEQHEVAGLIITTQDKATEKASVLAVAPNTNNVVMVGDLVLIPANKGMNVPEGRLININDILGVLE